MPPYSRNAGVSYAFATVVLSLYGVEVCPFIDDLGYGGVFPVFVGGFALAFLVRLGLVRPGHTPERVLLGELAAWLVAAAALTVFDAIVYGFPVGSGMRVMAGVVAFGLPFSTHQALLAERDQITQVAASGERRAPQGRAISVSTRLYAFVAASQIALSAVLLLLVVKDFKHVVFELEAGRTPSFIQIGVEIGGAFILLLAGTLLVTRRYGKNLDLLLRSQLTTLGAIAEGKLDRFVPVVGNDELGHIGDRTNDMIVGLKERERIKAVFGKLVSPAVAEAILAEEGGSELGGRELEAVVLFTDLRNFTAVSEKTSPQDVVSFLNEYFTMIVDSVHAHSGVVDKFIGDAAMAVFGLEGDRCAAGVADQAVLAALAMREGLGPVNERLAERGLPQIDNGIGLHLGRMVAGNIGSADRLEYTVIGDAVNTASRLESLCKSVGNPLLVSAALHERLSPEVAGRLESLGSFPVKGKTADVAVFGVRPLQ